MTTLTEKSYAADLIKEEPHRQISRVLGTISSAAVGVVKKFTVLGIVSASGKYLPYNPGASDGTQNAAGILISDDADATSADVANCVILRGEAVYSTAPLVWGTGVTTGAHKTAAYNALAATNLMAAPPA